MQQDKELEIQLQFLEEAQDYLGTLESTLLGLAGNPPNAEDLNAVLRAVHSIKGGASMMGFQVLSQLAHRLEDSFKVLKTQRHSVELDLELEGLLLDAVDCLRQVVAFDRKALVDGGKQHHSINLEWLESQASPVFDQLHARLGDPQEEDAASMLSPEDGQDFIPMLFQTEVEGCLQRLEAVLADPALPCLREELEIMAQELGGLGEMLQLEAFFSLCQSVGQQLAANPDQVLPLAREALSLWRRSQALIIVGQTSILPTALTSLSTTDVELASANSTSTNSKFVDLEQINLEQIDLEQDDLEQIDLEYLQLKEIKLEYQLEELEELENIEELEELKEPEELNQINVKEFDLISIAVEQFDLEKDIKQNVDVTVTTDLDQSFDKSFTDYIGICNDTDLSNTEDTDFFANFLTDVTQISHQPSYNEPASSATAPSRSPQPSIPKSDVKVLDVQPDSTTATELQDATVRVPVKRLNQLDDLFGELTIERNGLDLHLKRLHDLVSSLSGRVQMLERSNLQLRAAYDKVATSATSQPIALLPAASTPQNHLTFTSNAIAPPPGTSNNASETADQGLRNTFDVLEMDRYSNLHLLSQEVIETIVQIQEVTSDIELSLEETDQTARDLNKTAKQLQTNLTQVRMRPLSDILERFPRALRDLCMQYGKAAELKIHGGNTLIDRSILETLSDPLMHLLRNAFDHGIEDPEVRLSRGKPKQGLIEIRAFHRNNRTLITIRDDGQGISLDKIRIRAQQMGLDSSLLAAASSDELLSLIFEPGFSTKDEVTTLSGRGVGMDVVRDRLKRVRGEIKVDTQPGFGTTFTLSVPFTLSIVRVLLAESNNMLLAFPTDVIDEILLPQPDQIFTVAGGNVLKLQDAMVPLIHLAPWIKFRCSHQFVELGTLPTINTAAILTINQGTQRVGLQIDRCWGEQEATVRRVEGNITMSPGFNNCIILGDGRVVPLVNVLELLHWITSCERSPDDSAAGVTPEPDYAASDAQPLLSAGARGDRVFPAIPSAVKDTILIVDDSINVRRFLALTLEKAGYRVEQAKDGQDALERIQNGLQMQAVICDIEMPRLDGYGFLAQIKAEPKFAACPIVMLTSRSGDKHRQLAINLGASAYFSKPYNEKILLRTLKQLIYSE